MFSSQCHKGGGFVKGGAMKTLYLKSSPKNHLWNYPQKQMADPVFTNRPFSCFGKVW